MPAMFRRRIAALVAIFCVAFASLWPLVSAAMPRDPQIPVFICTHAGDSSHHQAPSDAGDDFHCPLCIASAEAVVPSMPAVHAAPALCPIAITANPYAVPDRLFSPRPPPTRAPPDLS
jgi:Protein of unknown function (DUF2946)